MEKQAVSDFITFSVIKDVNFLKFTVEPLLSGHPQLNSQIWTSQNFCNTNTINYSSI